MQRYATFKQFQRIEWVSSWIVDRAEAVMIPAINQESLYMSYQTSADMRHKGALTKKTPQGQIKTNKVK